MYFKLHHLDHSKHESGIFCYNVTAYVQRMCSVYDCVCAAYVQSMCSVCAVYVLRIRSVCDLQACVVSSVWTPRYHATQGMRWGYMTLPPHCCILCVWCHYCTKSWGTEVTSSTLVIIPALFLASPKSPFIPSTIVHYQTWGHKTAGKKTEGNIIVQVSNCENCWGHKAYFRGVWNRAGPLQPTKLELNINPEARFQLLLYLDYQLYLFSRAMLLSSWERMWLNTEVCKIRQPCWEVCTSFITISSWDWDVS